MRSTTDEAAVASASASRRPPGRRASSRARIGAWFVVAAAALVLSIVASLMVGANGLSGRAVIETLWGAGTGETQFVVWQQRLPRTVLGIAVGIGLGGAGALMQALTRNPLADPGILGVNAGAAAAVALGVVFFGVSQVGQYVWFAYAGALVLTIVVYLLGSSGRGRASPVKLTLAGLAAGAVLSGITTGLTLTNPDAFDRLLGWSAGSLLGRSLDVLVPSGMFLVVGVLLAVIVSPALNAVALGDDTAQGQGVNLTRTRLMTLTAITLLAGTATAIAGPISFVGLMVPHVVRWGVGVDHRRIVAWSMVVAPVLVLLSDITGRVLVLPAEMPVGIVTAFVGAPVLIVLVKRRRGVTGL
ncbi:iron chelate uptake ABC transporter family permease subunit [Frigoribacterium sp. 2-23]|uniref:iron chelate uptake ABC transporter family permease subunit n=1 Tax=Frigoribacterium sp. 2-23 TaxID=3415006 RepID=UPI003C6FCCC6